MYEMRDYVGFKTGCIGLYKVEKPTCTRARTLRLCGRSLYYGRQYIQDIPYLESNYPEIILSNCTGAMHEPMGDSSGCRIRVVEKTDRILMPVHDPNSYVMLMGIDGPFGCRSLGNSRLR
jgi:hypothetical protein